MDRKFRAVSPLLHSYPDANSTVPALIIAASPVGTPKVMPNSCCPKPKEYLFGRSAISRNLENKVQYVKWFRMKRHSTNMFGSKKKNEVC